MKKVLRLIILSILVVAVPIVSIVFAGNLTLPFNGNFPVSAYYDLGNGKGYNGGISYSGHQGTDYHMPNGTPILVMDDGVVVAVRDNYKFPYKDPETGKIVYYENTHDLVRRLPAGTKEWKAARNNAGNYIIVEHSDGTRTSYCHLQEGSISVKKGDKLSRGQQIGKSGNSGYSSKPHLDIKVKDKNGKKIDPYSNKKWTTDPPSSPKKGDPNAPQANRPGGDHPDETFDVSSGFASIDEDLMEGEENQPEGPNTFPYAFLDNGFYQGIMNLFEKYQVSFTPVQIDFSPQIVNEQKVLVIPSGGLYGLKNSAFLKASLDEYVKEGGTLIVFDQQHGYDYNILPVPQEADGTYRKIGGYGWSEDQNCFTDAVFINTWHQILSGQSRSTPTLNVDGYFSTYPSNTTVLLRRTANGQPALLTYDYGQGKVIVTSMYSDWAYGLGQASSEEIALVRDLITWAKKPVQLPEIKPGEGASITLSVANNSTTNAASAKILIYSPDRSAVLSEQTIALPIPAGQSAFANAGYQTTSNSPLGIYHIDYVLYDASGNVIQPQAETDSGRFIVSNPPKAGTPDKPIWFSVTTPSQEVLYGAPAYYTFHVYNNSNQTRNLTIKNIFRHTGRSHHWTVTANPNSEVTLSGTDSFIDPNMFETMEAHLYDESGKEIANYMLSFKGFYPLSTLDTAVDKKLYAKGEMVTINSSLKNGSPISFQPEVKISIRSPQGTVVFTDAKTINLQSYGTGSVSSAFTIPLASDTGTYSVHAEFVYGTQLLASANASFEVPRSRISVTPNLPPAYVAGTNTVPFALNNTGRVSVSAGNLKVSLKAPDGVEVYAGSYPFALSVGQGTTINVPVNIPSLKFGNYTLSYIQSDETKAGNAVGITIPNTAAVAAAFNKTSYRIRETANLTVTLTDTGQFNQDSMAVTVTVPDANYTDTRTVTLGQGKAMALPYPIPVPETVTAGLHNVNIALTLPSGNSITQSFPFAVPASSLTFGYSGPTALNAGDTISVNIANTGGVDTNFTYNVTLTNEGAAVYQNTINDLIQAGTSRPYSFQVPPQATSGTYFLNVDLLDRTTNKKIYPGEIFNISGVSGTLSVKTDKDIYLNTENLTALGRIMNQAYAINNANLHLQIVDKCAFQGGFLTDNMDFPIVALDGGRIIPPFGCRPALYWQADVPVAQAPNITADISRLVNPLSGTGQFYLQGTLLSSTGQMIAQVEYPFTIISGNTAVRFHTDKPVYRPGETVVITGDVVNLAPVEAAGVTLSVLLNNRAQIFTDTFNIPANGTHPFTATLTTGPQGSFSVSASVMQNGAPLASANGQLEVATPNLSVTTDAPAVVNRSPFQIRVTVNNTGRIPATMQIAAAGGALSDSQPITLQPGETRLIQYTQTITADTAYTLTITGDFNQVVTMPVAYGEGATIALNSQITFPEGKVAIPVTIANTGQLDETLSVMFSLQPSALNQTKTYYIQKGANTTDTLYFDLTEGDYTIAASSQLPAAGAQANFSVRKENKVTMAASVGVQTNTLIPVNVSLANLGYNAINGTLRARVSSQGDVWNSEQQVTQLASGGSQTFAFGVNTAAVRAGNYTLMIEAFDNGNRQLAAQSLPLTIKGAAFQLTQIPPYQTFAPNAEASFVFKVRNTGNQEGKVAFTFKAYDLADATKTEWLMPGEEKEFAFGFPVPADLEGNDYFANYRVQSEAAGQAVNSGEGQVKYRISGVSLNVNASLDKQSYREGETAHLVLTVGQNSFMNNQNLFARVNYNGYGERKPFTLSGSQTLTFDIPLTQITGEKLFYGIYYESGRSLHLNSLYIYKTGDAINIATNKQVYNPGEAVDVSITGAASGQMTLTGPGGYSETFAFSGSAAKSFVLPSLMTAGTYFINARLTAPNAQPVTVSQPFDVAGIQVKVKEATLDKGKYAASDSMNLTLLIESNKDMPATLRTWIADPEGSYTKTGEQDVALSSKDNVLVSYSSPLVTVVAGIHRLVYGIYAGELLLVSGSEAFDVGDAVLLGLSTNKTDYPLNAEPVIARVEMLGTGSASLELQLDGETVRTETVMLNGVVSKEIMLNAVKPGSHVLKGTLISGNLKSTKETSFVYNMRDTLPPVTTATIGNPFFTAGSTTYISAVTPITLSAVDEGTPPSGVDYTEYKVDNDAWARYTNPFTLMGKTDGLHTISYRSVDKAGNTEDTKTSIVYLDTTPPVSTITIGIPYYQAGSSTYIGGNTPLTITATDGASGVAATEYSIDRSPYSPYTAAFNLNALTDGSHTISYRSVDNVANKETEKTATLIVDKTPPVTTITASDPLVQGAVNTVSPTTGFSLFATDALSGVKAIYYRIDQGGWTTYSGSFRLTTAGTHTIGYKAADNLGNEEAAEAITVRVIVIDVSKAVSVDPIVLAGGWEHEHKAQSAITNLTSIFSSSGLSYYIPQTEEEFKEHLRAGRYNTYIILDSEDEDLTEEIKSAVHFGDGLIYLKTESDDEHKTSEVFGVQFNGMSTNKDILITLIESDISHTGIMQSTGKAVRTTITSPAAKNLGSVADKKNTYPVVISNQYGRGKVVLFTFDLLNSPDQGKVKDLIINSINYVAPKEHYTHALSDAPININIENSTEPADIRVTEAVPVNTTVDSIKPETTPTGNTIQWQLTLASNEKKKLGYWLNLPDAAGDYLTSTSVNYNNLGNYRLYGNYTLNLNVALNSTDLLRSIITDIQNLIPSTEKDMEKIQEATEELSRMNRNAATRKEAKKNIKRILEAIEELSESSLDTLAIVPKLDELLKIWQKKWSLMPVEHETDDDDKDDKHEKHKEYEKHSHTGQIP